MKGIGVTLWRDYDGKAAAITGMSMGAEEITSPVAHYARELFRRGCRRVTLDGVVDLAPGSDEAAATAVRSLCLVRELTSVGVMAKWRLRLDGNTAWQALSHLYPPMELLYGDDGILDEWRSAYRIGRLAYRRGPGFIQVRDCRWGGMRRFTIEQPHYLQTLDTLGEGSQAEMVPARVLDRLSARHLISRVGNTYWRLPYRMRRWPDPR